MTWRRCFMGCSMRVFTTSSSRLSAASSRFGARGSSGMGLLPSSFHLALSHLLSGSVLRRLDHCSGLLRCHDDISRGVNCFPARVILGLVNGLCLLELAHAREHRFLSLDYGIEFVKKDAETEDHARSSSDQFPIMAQARERELDVAVALDEHLVVRSEGGLGHLSFLSFLYLASRKALHFLHCRFK